MWVAGFRMSLGKGARCYSILTGSSELYKQTILRHAARQGTAALTHFNQLCKQSRNSLTEHHIVEI